MGEVLQLFVRYSLIAGLRNNGQPVCAQYRRKPKIVNEELIPSLPMQSKTQPRGDVHEFIRCSPSLLFSDHKDTKKLINLGTSPILLVLRADVGEKGFAERREFTVCSLNQIEVAIKPNTFDGNSHQGTALEVFFDCLP